MSVREVTRAYLEMRQPSDLVAARSPDGAPRVERVGYCPTSFFRYLYAEVGRAYRWTDRLVWSDQQVRAYLDAGDVALYLLSIEGAPAGYFELRHYPDRSIEVAYLGLLGEYIGRGLGGWLLTQAVQTAWAEKPDRVCLHTSTLDHPNALPNYLRRGFQPVRREVYQVDAG